MTTFEYDLRELTAIANRLGVGAAAERLTTVSTLSGDFTAIVVGEFKQGKSQLVCALAESPVSPPHVRLPTGPAVVARHGQDDSVVRHDRGGDATFDLADVSRAIYEVAPSADGHSLLEVTSSEWALPHQITLVDTPGGGLNAPSGVVVREIAQSCDAVLFVTDAARELTADEIALVQTLRGHAALLCVLTKVDLYAGWQRMLSTDVEHLRTAVGEVRVLPTSTSLFALGLRGDTELLEESGVPAVRRWLSAAFEQAQSSQELPVRRVAAEIVEELEAIIANERTALDPARTTASRERLMSAKLSAERVLSGESLWLVELRDGINDVDRRLTRGLERLQHDLMRQASELIGQSDPAQNWDEFATVFTNSVVEATAVLYTELTNELERAVQVAIKQFAVKAGEVVLELQSSDLLELPEVELAKARRQPIPILDVADESWTKIEALQVIGMQARLTSPFGLLVAAFLGRRILRSKRGELLEGRRQQARQTVADFLAELVLEQRDLMERELKVIHDRVRDQLIERAEQAVRGWDEALAQLDAHNSMDQWSRDDRLEVLAEAQRGLGRVRSHLASAPSQN